MITLILGGARSGKSSFAESLARECPVVTYIATADSKDSEMEARIETHRNRRPSNWHTWEGDIASLEDDIAGMEGTLLLDCLTMYLSRMLLAQPESEGSDEAAWNAAERLILASVEKIFSRAGAAGKRLIAVSNETGLGLVPPYLLGRRFRDTQGRANQIAAGLSDEVALMVAGLPLWLKRP
ncbi:MAG: bifunctional adenosylcobinamide kinase/adenosylcobinamide-phosphate guanylyltransferase [Synergistaceae bacterium]|nr:bifunctional adenosylcobinamide kinase/adenosylcobinamide-phosphate guanylyltransferase [Synergistaceae bacterium]